eukprot:CAMPEP_0119546556 /NCGR_PEP_ID=MMETSP1352-20130426/925_1 /TAXON_ID=265584 /ORGANISM="Stauroneis constricta, Strain CCMP1120" /LENGTH=611 /DNA_ID=CAMNT_0007591275 /DNA_START=90 /DNA_END=1925 /DNA_ORIENTATION=+
MFQQSSLQTTTPHRLWSMPRKSPSNLTVKELSMMQFGGEQPRTVDGGRSSSAPSSTREKLHHYRRQHPHHAAVNPTTTTTTMISSLPCYPRPPPAARQQQQQHHHERSNGHDHHGSFSSCCSSTSSFLTQEEENVDPYHDDLPTPPSSRASGAKAEEDYNHTNGDDDHDDNDDLSKPWYACILEPNPIEQSRMVVVPKLSPADMIIERGNDKKLSTAVAHTAAATTTSSGTHQQRHDGYHCDVEEFIYLTKAIFARREENNGTTDHDPNQEQESWQAASSSAFCCHDQQPRPAVALAASKYSSALQQQQRERQAELGHSSSSSSDHFSADHFFSKNLHDSIASALFNEDAVGQSGSRGGEETVVKKSNYMIPTTTGENFGCCIGMRPNGNNHLFQQHQCHESHSTIASINHATTMNEQKSIATSASSSSAISKTPTTTRTTQQHQWEMRFKELLQFRKEHGHSSVPNNFPGNRQLAQWVKRQRYMYRARHSTSTTTACRTVLSQDRVDKLDAIGFIWDTHSTMWEERFMELLEFKHEHGHCIVPARYAKNRQLAVWVKQQRRQMVIKRSGMRVTISEDRINRLNSIGFCWDPRRGVSSTTGGGEEEQPTST